jgi:hypothetical protein
VMANHRTEHDARIPVRPCSASRDDSVDAPDPDDASRQGRHRSTRRGNVMVQAMDELNLVLIHLSGTTPQEVADRREK